MFLRTQGMKQFNKSYAEMAEYDETAIVPARVRAPQDKSLAEGTVKFATTWIIAALRNRKFFSLEEVKSAVKESSMSLIKLLLKKGRDAAILLTKKKNNHS